MFKLNRMTDYAIIVLGALAHRRGEVLNSVQLAELTGISQTTVAKVARRLQTGDLLATRRGANGGYRLERAPEDISLVTVVEAIDGPIAVNGCVDGAQDPCAVSHCCFMSSQWNKVNGKLRKALAGISLADLIDPSQIFSAPRPARAARPADHARAAQPGRRETARL